MDNYNSGSGIVSTSTLFASGSAGSATATNGTGTGLESRTFVENPFEPIVKAPVNFNPRLSGRYVNNTKSKTVVQYRHGSPKATRVSKEPFYQNLIRKETASIRRHPICSNVEGLTLSIADCENTANNSLSSDTDLRPQQMTQLLYDNIDAPASSNAGACQGTAPDNTILQFRNFSKQMKQMRSWMSGLGQSNLGNIAAHLSKTTLKVIDDGAGIREVTKKLPVPYLDSLQCSQSDFSEKSDEMSQLQHDNWQPAETMWLRQSADTGTSTRRADVKPSQVVNEARNENSINKRTSCLKDDKQHFSEMQQIDHFLNSIQAEAQLAVKAASSLFSNTSESLNLCDDEKTAVHRSNFDLENTKEKSRSDKQNLDKSQSQESISQITLNCHKTLPKYAKILPVPRNKPTKSTPPKPVTYKETENELSFGPTPPKPVMYKETENELRFGPSVPATVIALPASDCTAANHDHHQSSKSSTQNCQKCAQTLSLDPDSAQIEEDKCLSSENAENSSLFTCSVQHEQNSCTSSSMATKTIIVDSNPSQPKPLSTAKTTLQPPAVPTANKTVERGLPSCHLTLKNQLQPVVLDTHRHSLDGSHKFQVPRNISGIEPLDITNNIKKVEFLKKIAEEKEKKMLEESVVTDRNDKSPFFCRLCLCDCVTGRALANHTMSKVHRERYWKKKPKQFGDSTAQSPEENHKQFKDEKLQRSLNNNEQSLSSQDVKILPIPSALQPLLDSCDLPLIGVQYLREMRKEGTPAIVYCSLCECSCDVGSKAALRHLLGIKHRTLYLQKRYQEYHQLLGTLSMDKSQLADMLEEYAIVIEKEEGRWKPRVCVPKDQVTVCWKRPVDCRKAAAYTGKKKMRLDSITPVQRVVSQSEKRDIGHPRHTCPVYHQGVHYPPALSRPAHPLSTSVTFPMNQVLELRSAEMADSLPFTASHRPYLPTCVNLAPPSPLPGLLLSESSPWQTLGAHCLSHAASVPPSHATQVPPTFVSPSHAIRVPHATPVPPLHAAFVQPSPATSVQPSPATSVQPSPATFVPPSPATSVPPSPATSVQPSPVTSVQPPPATSVPPSPATSVQPSSTSSLPLLDSTGLLTDPLNMQQPRAEAANPVSEVLHLLSMLQKNPQSDLTSPATSLGELDLEAVDLEQLQTSLSPSCLVSNDMEASMALQLSKLLTEALLKYKGQQKNGATPGKP